jgi:two-component sensor histidine kinase
LPDEAPSLSRALLAGVVLAAAATAARAALEAPIGHELPFITYFPALIFAAALGGRIGGVTCLLLSTGGAYFLFLPGGAPPLWAIASFWVSGGLVVLVADGLADSVRALRRSQAQINEAQDKLHTLVGELAHRNRNALTVIMSIVSQSARSAGSAEEAERIINERLGALARSQELLLESEGGSASLRALLEAAVAPFGLDRFTIAPSPDAEVAADAAAPLGLLFHEMATNAMKHGALSEADGRVLVDWTVDDGAAHLRWREVDGPASSEPARRGFGTRLLSAALSPHGGKVERRFEPDGVVCDLHVPAKPVPV